MRFQSPEYGIALNGSSMLCLLPKLAGLMLLASSAISLAGCSDSLSSGDKSFATTLKGYDKALTPAQQQAAIAELKKEQAKRRAETTGTVATPASAKPVQQ